MRHVSLRSVVVAPAVRPVTVRLVGVRAVGVAGRDVAVLLVMPVVMAVRGVLRVLLRVLLLMLVGVVRAVTPRGMVPDVAAAVRRVFVVPFARVLRVRLMLVALAGLARSEMVPVSDRPPARSVVPAPERPARREAPVARAGLLDGR